MHHIQRLQVLAKLAIELLVRVPKELSGWFVVLLKALVEIDQYIVVLHKWFNLFDNLTVEEKENG